MLLTTPEGGSNVPHFTDDDVHTPVYVSLVRRPEAGRHPHHPHRHRRRCRIDDRGHRRATLHGRGCRQFAPADLQCSLPPRQYYKRVAFVVTTPGGTSEPFLD